MMEFHLSNVLYVIVYLITNLITILIPVGIILLPFFILELRYDNRIAAWLYIGTVLSILIISTGFM